MSGPDITCNRCGTVTTWNPYCPTCSAYLEFAGTPAWRPDAELASPDADPWFDASTGVMVEGDQHGPVVPAPEPGSPHAELPGHVLTTGLATHALLTEQRDIGSGNRVCPACGHANADWRALCEHCGSTLPGALLAPLPTPMNTPSHHGHDHTLGPERSGWAKWLGIALGMAGLAFIVWYLFFGPRAADTRTDIVVAAQTIWEFVDPTSGVSASVSTVTASSSLPGTLPQSLADANSRTFWASDVDSAFGAGSSLVITFTSPVEIDRLLIQPGIQNGQLDVRALNTPMEVTIDLGSGPPIVRQLHSIQEQSDYQQVIEFPNTTTTQARITINSVYPPRYASEGSTVGSVAISSLDFLRVPSRETVLKVVVPSNVPTSVPSIPGVPAVPAVPGVPTVPAVPALPQPPAT